MRRLTRPAAIVAVLCTAFAAPPCHAASYRVVVHADNPLTSISAEHLERIYLKKTTHWEDGTPIDPVDQAPDRSVREAFSQEILGRGVGAVKSYWQRQLFSGRETPPVELGSERQVLDYVSSNRYAVGYVSAGVSLGSGVKAIEIRD